MNNMDKIIRFLDDYGYRVTSHLKEEKGKEEQYNAEQLENGYFDNWRGITIQRKENEFTVIIIRGIVRPDVETIKIETTKLENILRIIRDYA